MNINQTTPITGDSYTKYQPIEELIEEMDIPKQDVNKDKPPDIITPVELDLPQKKPVTEPVEVPVNPVNPVKDYNDGDEPVKPTKTLGLMAKGESEFLAKQNDRVQAFICAVIAKEDEPERFKADSEELQEIADYIYAWRKDSIKPLPPWIMILLAIALIYMPKYTDAIKLRKEKKQIIDQQTEIDFLRQQTQAQAELLKKAEAEKNKSENNDTEPAK